MQHAKQNKKNARHKCSDGETAHAILLNDAVDNDNEGSCGAAYLHFTATKNRDNKTCYDGSNNSFLR